MTSRGNASRDSVRSGRATSTRRDFLKTSGFLVVGVSATSMAGPFSSIAQAPASGRAAGAGPYPDPDFHQLDSWIVVRQDNTATFYVGKTDLGQGTGTAFRQVMSDELDIPFESTSCVMGSTDITVDQGGSGGSDALQTDGWPMRRVAAEARRVLLEMASAKLGVPVAALTVQAGVVSATADPSKKITYGELIGDKRFNVTLTGDDINKVTGKAPLKPVQELKNVGQSPPRDDIPRKVDGSLKWAVDVKLPGMLHARNVKPPVAGAKLVSIDESSVRGIPGFVRVVSKGNYVSVVCEREEQAIQAARALKVDWQKPASPSFPRSEDLFTYLRSATPTAIEKPQVEGDPDAAFATAAKVLDADYDVPFQGHTAIGPAHAMADPSNDQMTIYTNDMKSYGQRNGIAKFLQMPRDRVRVVWMDGPQAYGRTAADDAGFEAAFLARELGRPVRIQWMRDEETAWDTKGPAYAVKMRGGLDEKGNVVVLEYDGRAADHNHLGYNEHDSVLIAQLAGLHRAEPARGRASFPQDKYSIPNRRLQGSVVSLPLVWETPVRTGNLRDPDGPQVTFAVESFIDELAAAAGADPLEFRLRLLSTTTDDDDGFRRTRALAVIKAAAEAYGWDTRASPSPNARATGDILTGRGMAHAYRSQTMVAQIAEVEVNRRTGHVWARRLVCAHDCGLVVNPVALKATVECGMLHSLSRALHEEVQFDTEKVTSVNWASSPTLTHRDVPERIDVVLVNGDPNPQRPDLPHYGAGEATCKPTLAAIANAIFDATGVRLRRVPFRDERVQAALQAAGV
jgi:nicotinate dehydrogenase subunit B